MAEDQQGTEGVTADAEKATASRSLSLRANILWLYGLMGMNYLIPAALLPYLVRVLGADQYGLIAFAQSIAQYFIIATDYGFNFTASRDIAHAPDDRERVRDIFWTTIITKISFLMIGLVLLVAMLVCIPRFQHDSAIYLAAYISVAGNVLFPQWLFQGLQRMRSITVITSLAKLVAAAMIFFFVHKPQDALLATVLQSSGFLIAGITGIIVAVKSHVGAPKLPSWRQVRETIIEGRHVFLSTASITLYTNTNVFLVGLLAGTVQAAYFSLADKFIRAVTGLIFPVLQAGYPHIVQLQKESRAKALAFFRKTVVRGVGAGILVGIGIVIFAWPVATFCFKQNAAGVLPLLRIVALFPPLAVITASMGMLVFVPFGMDKAYGRLLFGIGVVNVVLACSLIPFFGAFGAGLGMILMEMIQVVAGVYVLRRHGVHVMASVPALEESEA